MLERKNVGLRLLLMVLLMFMLSMTVYAEGEGLEDEVGGNYSQASTGTGATGSSDVFGDIANQPIDADDQGVIDWLGSQRSLTSEQLGVASNTLSPIVTFVGYVTGGVICLTVVLITLVTACDLMYIAVPPIRGLLYTGNSSGGMGGGYSMGGYGMRGRYGMGGMGATGGNGGGRPRQLISDEAVACAAMTGGEAGNSSAMGMGMGAMQANNNQASTRSVIGLYFQKRLVFILLFAICVVVLTSSALMGCGVNLASWVLKLLAVINGKLQ